MADANQRTADQNLSGATSVTVPIGLEPLRSLFSITESFNHPIIQPQII